MVAGSRRGFREWLVQRFTAIVIGLYTLFIFYHLFCSGMDYAGWQGLFSQPWVSCATLIVLFAVLWHAWIGLWTVFTDYVKNKALRLVLEVAVLLLCGAYMVWAIFILFLW